MVALNRNEISSVEDFALVAESLPLSGFISVRVVREGQGTTLALEHHRGAWSAMSASSARDAPAAFPVDGGCRCGRLPTGARPFGKAAAKIYCENAVKGVSHVVNSQRGRHRPPDCDDAHACVQKSKLASVYVCASSQSLTASPKQSFSKAVLTPARVPLEASVRVIARWRFLGELAAVRH